jgi:hypothetical protein
MVGPTRSREQVLGPVGPAQRPAAGHHEGDPNGPLSPQVAALYQRFVNQREFQDLETLTQRCNEI